FAYYSLESDAEIDREPLSQDWDLTFTRYTDRVMGMAYPVAGVLHNHTGTVSEGRDTPLALAEPEEFSAEINTIGYDWKTFDFEEGWIVEADLSYFCSDPAGEIYQLIFTEFGGSETGDYTFGQSHFGTLGTRAENAPRLALYPNPSTGTI